MFNEIAIDLLPICYKLQSLLLCNKPSYRVGCLNTHQFVRHNILLWRNNYIKRQEFTVGLIKVIISPVVKTHSSNYTQLKCYIIKLFPIYSFFFGFMIMFLRLQSGAGGMVPQDISITSPLPGRMQHW